MGAAGSGLSSRNVSSALQMGSSASQPQPDVVAPAPVEAAAAATAPSIEEANDKIQLNAMLGNEKSGGITLADSSIDLAPHTSEPFAADDAQSDAATVGSSIHPSELKGMEPSMQDVPAPSESVPIPPPSESTEPTPVDNGVPPLDTEAGQEINQEEVHREATISAVPAASERLKMDTPMPQDDISVLGLSRNDIDMHSPISTESAPQDPIEPPMSSSSDLNLPTPIPEEEDPLANAGSTDVGIAESDLDGVQASIPTAPTPLQTPAQGSQVAPTPIHGTGAADGNVSHVVSGVDNVLEKVHEEQEQDGVL